jgi:hypothetical protein
VIIGSMFGEVGHVAKTKTKTKKKAKKKTQTKPPTF